ncbi:hypothetical protein [Aquicoccus sp.]|uniref:hypothetical protein n=1 Tax=Aquicoccus sp. TaxID=2055851 RepID=UPI00356ACF47
MKRDRFDPKGLIFEAYRIDGISMAECRTIFLDWALSLPEEMEARRAITALIERHGAERDHPMTQVLREGLEQAQSTGRRGGRAGRARQ